jgi:hypothetical protein
MKFKPALAWAVMLALAASLSIWPIAQAGRSSTEDRNCDGLVDVWQFYDEDDDLVRELRDRNFDGYMDVREMFENDRVVSRALDQNFDHRFDPSVTDAVFVEHDDTFSVAAQTFLLPRAVFIGDHPIEDPAPVTLDAVSEARSVANPSGRAPPASL